MSDDTLVTRDQARRLLTMIREDPAWFTTGKMIEPYEQQAVERLRDYMNEVLVNE